MVYSCIVFIYSINQKVRSQRSWKKNFLQNFMLEGRYDVMYRNGSLLALSFEQNDFCLCEVLAAYENTAANWD
jgi:hypothetical protein